MISLKVVTPRGRYLEEDVQSIHACSMEGEFTLLSNHMPVVMTLVPCRLVLTFADGHREDFAISGGVLHFDNNKAALLTDAIEGRAEIDIPRAQAAYRRARLRMEKADTDANLKKSELALKRAVNRLHVTDTPVN